MKITIAVRPGIAEIGICDKEGRGIVSEQEGIPDGLKNFENALSSLSLKLKLSLSDQTSVLDVQSALRQYEANLPSERRVDVSSPGITL